MSAIVGAPGRPSVRPCPVGRIAQSVLRRPGIPLLGDESLRIEHEERGPGERFLRSVLRRDERPPVDSRTHIVDDRRPEPARSRGLVAERPCEILGGCLALTEGVGVEDGAFRVEGRDGRDISLGPRALPRVGPALRGRPCVYFATSMALLSRITITLTWPGYSS